MIIGKKLLPKHSPMSVIGYSTIFGTIFLLPITLYLSPSLTISTVSSLSWLLIFYLAASGIVGYYFWFCALEKMYASKVAVFDYLIPVFSTIMAIIFLNEIITVYTIVGGAAIILGINLVERKW